MEEVKVSIIYKDDLLDKINILNRDKPFIKDYCPGIHRNARR